MSDGPADARLDSLRPRPIAVVVLAVVINKAAGVGSLTTDQLKRIYAGQINNWRDINGKDLPIKMVSRIGPDSGSRQIFEKKVLNDGEQAISSDDCAKKTRTVDYHRCEVRTTNELLERVDNIEGAIGYADLGAARKYSGTIIAKIDDHSPGVAAVKDGQYRFWAVEYAYTVGEPESDSLTAAFLDYIDRTAGETLRRQEFIPCVEVKATTLCA